MTPQYLKNNLPPLRRPLYRRDTLDTQQEISCRATKYINSFFLGAVRIWNNIGIDFQTWTLMSRFKRHTLSLIHPKAVFGIHDPAGLRYLFLLRVKLSPLRYHFLHFLFAEQMRTLAIHVFAILRNHKLTHLLNETEVYLYGNKALGLADEKSIILATIEYIKKLIQPKYLRKFILLCQTYMPLLSLSLAGLMKPLLWINTLKNLL